MTSRSPLASASADPDTLERMRRLARSLDTSIPLPGGLRIGWDAVLGLVPVVGDWAGAVFSSYIILQAVRLGASREVLLRMVGNVALEALAGSVPFVGDIFDAAWRANTRNVSLLEAHLASPVAARRASRAWVFAVAVMLIALVALASVLAVLAFRALLSAVHSA